MKWVVLLFCLLVSGVSSAQNCVTEGAWVMSNEGSPQNCCQGLQLLPVDPRTGTKGQCLRKENGRFCIGDKGSILNYNGAVNECCPGLQKTAPTINDSRIAFVCLKEVSCIKEGDWAPVRPGAPECCKNLVRYAPPGRLGSVQCVKPEERNCVHEEQPLFQYPGAPACCKGLEVGRPSVYSPMGFTEVCVKKVTGSNRSGVNNSEQRKSIDIDPGVHLIEDSPGVSNQ